ncbi:MAG: hypothetical protein ABI369_13785 [Acetobacteraceae bacterium]
MRLALFGLLAAGLFSAEVAIAEPCATTVDQGAFDTMALKSELMVVALTCEQRPQYNQFIEQFRPDLTREEKALNGWFSRAYGKRSRTVHDEYITNLANAESQTGLQRGTLFCKDHAELFPTVMRLHGAVELVNFASHRTQPQPIVLAACNQARPTGSPTRRVMRTAEKGR